MNSSAPTKPLAQPAHVYTTTRTNACRRSSRWLSRFMPKKLATAAQQMGELNEEAIRAKIDAEKEREREHGGAGKAS